MRLWKKRKRACPCETVPCPPEQEADPDMCCVYTNSGKFVKPDGSICPKHGKTKTSDG